MQVVGNNTKDAELFLHLQERQNFTHHNIATLCSLVGVFQAEGPAGGHDKKPIDV